MSSEMTELKGKSGGGAVSKHLATCLAFSWAATAMGFFCRWEVGKV